LVDLARFSLGKRGVEFGEPQFPSFLRPNIDSWEKVDLKDGESSEWDSVHRCRRS